MAKQIGVFDCWASYGRALPGPDVDFLVSVTDWSDADVEVFYRNTPAETTITPSFVARSFEEFVRLVLFDWEQRVTEPAPTQPVAHEQLDFWSRPEVEMIQTPL